MVLYSILQVEDNFVPPLLDAVLLDYQKNVPAAREPEVLSTMATIIDKLEVRMKYNSIFFDIGNYGNSIVKKCTTGKIN